MTIPAHSLPSPTWLVLRFLLVYGTIALALTATAIFLIWQDQSWGALWIAIIGAPVANLILLVLGLIGAGTYLRRYPTIGKRELLPSVITIPFIAAIFTFASLFLMDLHGC